MSIAEAGELAYPVALEMPVGIDCDVKLYFISDKKCLETVITIEGVTGIVTPENLMKEAVKFLLEPAFVNSAPDWRFMTSEERIDYRRRLIASRKENV
jgi:hypothetical protein